MTGNWIAEQIAASCETVSRLTVIVLDIVHACVNSNTRVHKKAVKDHAAAWEEEDLFVLFLPTYAPHLNIVEILWKALKYEWLKATDYADKETLHIAVRSKLEEIGKSRKMAFEPFRKVQPISA